MFEIIDKITKSRNILHELLSERYDVSKLPLYSPSKIDEIYSIPIERNNPFAVLGNAVGCNFSLIDKNINSVKIHVFYYNFPEYKSEKSTKLNIADPIDLAIEEGEPPSNELSI